MKIALYLGCMVPKRAKAYEISARKVLDALGIKYDDINDFRCCGLPMKPASLDASYLMGLRNLALAEMQGYDLIIALCNGCSSQLLESAYEFEHNEKFRESAMQSLKTIGKTYEGKIQVKHIIRYLWEDIGVKKIEGYVKNPLEGLRVAAHYGCHFIKPSEVYGFDSVENPHSLGELVDATGAKSIRYRDYNYCCGGTIVGIDKDSAYAIARQKLDSITEVGADCMVLGCPFCAAMYDTNQRMIERTFETQYKLPVLYYTQLLGLSMGFDTKELGLNQNKVKPKEMLAKLGIEG